MVARQSGRSAWTLMFKRKAMEESKMSNVIQFLEALGSKPMSPADYAASVNALEADTAQKGALLRHDGHALNGLLDARASVYCAVFAEDAD
jgi:hypothetical protein